MILRRVIGLLNMFKLYHEKEDYRTVIEKIEKSIYFRGTNLWILIFAIFIASLGLNVNSTAVVIGAMLISPLMGPIMGIGLSLGIHDWPLLKKSFINFGFATAVGLVASTLFFFISPISDAHSEILARTQPNIFDVLIAFCGGLAGVLAVNSKLKGNVIPGVAIATALMPPLCTAGYGIATMQWSYCFGASYLYLINSVFIALSTFLTVKVLNFPVMDPLDSVDQKRNSRLITTVTLLTLLPSIYFGYKFIVENRFKSKANQFVELFSNIPNEYLLSKKINPQSREVTMVFGGAKMNEEQIERLQRDFDNFGFEDAKLIVRQGIAYMNDEKETLKISTELSEKDARILKLQVQIDSLNRLSNMSQQIYSELKVTYPKIQSFSIQYHQVVTDSSSLNVPLCVVYSSKTISDTDLVKISDFLKLRLNLKNIRLINES